MKKVFCITCHQLNSPLKLTVGYLSSFDDNLIIIHVDNKSDIRYFLTLKSHNVILLSERVDVFWGGFSQIQSTLLLLNKAVEIKFDYLFFLSGDDLPCVSNESIDAFLQEINYKNMIHYQDFRGNYVDPIARVKYSYPSIFFSKDKSLPRKIKKKIFKATKFLFINPLYKMAVDNGVVFYKGTNWFSLNYATVCKVTSFIESNKWYVDLFNKSLYGDEVFFHTLLKFIGIEDLYHDPSKKNDALRYLDWDSGPEFPKVLDGSDISKIKKSGCLFARKFSNDADENFLHKLIVR